MSKKVTAIVSNHVWFRWPIQTYRRFDLTPII